MLILKVFERKKIKKDKIKVLEVLHGLAHGGIESFVMSITDNIDVSQFQVDYALATDFPQFHEKHVLENGNRIYRTKNLGSFKNNWLHFIRLIRLIRTEHYDVVHTHIDYFNGINLFAAWLGGAKVRICHSHNTRSANADRENEPIKVKIYHFLMRILINLFATDKIGCSTAANKWLYGKTKDCKVIYNAIDLRKFNPRNYNREKLQDEYSINRKEHNFVTVGRIVEQKNPLFLAEIICEYTKLDSDFHFHWISSGRLQKDVEKILERGNASEKVTFWGERKDIPELLACMDYFIFPSLWEGLGIVLIEAQAMGIPCFCSERIPSEADIGGLIRFDLSEGPEIWAKKIKGYQENYEKKIVTNKKQLDQYNIETMIREIEKIYSVARTGE